MMTTDEKKKLHQPFPAFYDHQLREDAWHYMHAKRSIEGEQEDKK